MLVLINHIIVLFFSLFIKTIICNFKLNMKQSFENENTFDIFMNEVRMEDEPLWERKENASVQTEGSINLKINEEIMKENLRKLHAQRLFWKLHNINALCWALLCVNDNNEVDLIALQIMRWIFCYNSLVLNLNPKIKQEED